MAHEAQRDPVEWWRSYRRDLYDSEPQAEEQPKLSDPEQKPKGWKRASFDLNTHPLHPFPKVRQKDFLVPLYADRLKLFAACLVCGAGLSVLWVYFPLLLISIPLNANFGIWFWVAMGTFAAVATVGLFLYASAREKHYVEF